MLKVYKLIVEYKGQVIESAVLAAEPEQSLALLDILNGFTVRPFGLCVYLDEQLDAADGPKPHVVGG